MRLPTARPSPLEWGCLPAAAGLLLAYRWIMDDAFVYFRVVDNFVFLDLGWVNNPGEFVEGTSSPAWLLLLTALRALGLPYPVIVAAVGLAVLVAMWAMLVTLRHAQVGPDAGLALPMVLLLPNYAVLSYLTSGVDAPLVLLVGCAYALFFWRPRSRPLRALVAVSPLVRHELAIPFALAVAWAWHQDRRLPAGFLLGGVASVGAWVLFRVWIYADFFPVTYYLKNELLPAWGLLYVHDTLAPYHLYEILAGAGGLAFLLARRGVPLEGRRRAAMLATALAVALWVIKIGGDARHFRYLAFPCCLAAAALGGIPEKAAAAWRLPRPRLVLPLGGLVLALLTFSFHPRQLDRHPLRPGVRHRMVDRITEAQLHRDVIIPSVANWSDRVTPDALRGFRRSDRFGRPWPVLANELCIENYVAFDRHVIQSYGLTDAILARADVPSDRPGHKDDLVWMSEEMARILRHDRGPHAISDAAGRGRAPRWIVENVETIRRIEEKIHNRHHLGENLRMALQGPLTVTVPGTRGPRRGND